MKRWARVFSVLLKGLATIFLICLLLLPIVAIYFITTTEMNKYVSAELPSIQPVSYGIPVQVVRKDVKEYFFLSGIVESRNRIYMELPKLNRQYEARWEVELGDYIEEGTVIGKTADGKSEIVADVSGYLIEIHLGQYSYLILDDAEDLVFRCNLTEKEIAALAGESSKLSDSKNRPIELVSVAARKNADNTKAASFIIQDAIYGSIINQYKVYSGKVYSGALVVPKSCLFHTESDKESWYVRVVSESGTMIEDVKVQIGYTTDQEVCVVGVKEGMWLDSGYASFMGDGYESNAD